MALIHLTEAYLSFSDVPLFDHMDLHVEHGERIAIVGRNGTGKSTLLKVINGEFPLDDGRIIYEDGLIIARLEQDLPHHMHGTVADFIAEGLSKQSSLLKRYHRVLKRIETDPSDNHLRELARLQSELDHSNGWQMENKIVTLIHGLALDGEAPIASLSGGQLRKAAFAKTIISEPDVLLLDEPTNHLDVDSIICLESFLKNFNGSIIFISHDRRFINTLATRIIDLDRGKITSWPGDYQKYLIRKEEWLGVEFEKNALFDKKLAREEVWIRQGIKARRTRNEGRVRALRVMRTEQSARRTHPGNAKMQVEEALHSGEIIFNCQHVEYSRHGHNIIADFSAIILRGDKIALVGANGSGKTTLLKLLLNQLQPDRGRIQCGTRLEIAYFDQYRAELDLDKTVMDNVAGGKQEVMVKGKVRHILSYLQDFLFAPHRARTPVRALSGGERHRLLLAKLFLTPSNLLILDEPTNDLDVETLELLEDLIQNYTGTVLLVSHDRQFVDNCITQCFLFEKEKIFIYPGGYQDAVLQHKQSTSFKKEEKAKEVQKIERLKTINPVSVKKKLSYKETQELATLPNQIEELEIQISLLQARVSENGFFNRPYAETQLVLEALKQLEKKCDAAYKRWQFLEALQGQDKHNYR